VNLPQANKQMKNSQDHKGHNKHLFKTLTMLCATRALFMNKNMMPTPK
jgi:hypothetical protein